MFTSTLRDYLQYSEGNLRLAMKGNFALKVAENKNWNISSDKDMFEATDCRFFLTIKDLGRIYKTVW